MEEIHKKKCSFDNGAAMKNCKKEKVLRATIDHETKFQTHVENSAEICHK